MVYSSILNKNDLETMTAEGIVGKITKSSPREPYESTFFYGKAVDFFSSIMRVLVFLRDNGVITLSPSVIKQAIEIEGTIALATGDSSVFNMEIPDAMISPLRLYLDSCGFDDKKEHQDEGVIRRHGFSQFYVNQWISNYEENPFQVKQ